MLQRVDTWLLTNGQLTPDHWPADRVSPRQDKPMWVDVRVLIAIVHWLRLKIYFEISAIVGIAPFFLLYIRVKTEIKQKENNIKYK